MYLDNYKKILAINLYRGYKLINIISLLRINHGQGYHFENYNIEFFDKPMKSIQLDTHSIVDLYQET
jgi:hypothetical protein